MTKKTCASRELSSLVVSDGSYGREALDKLENVLRANGVEKLTSRVTTSYSNEERERLL